MKYNIFTLISFLIVLGSCDDILRDKTDLAALNDDQTFKDSTYAQTYVDYIYEQNLPGWPSSSGTIGTLNNCTDEFYASSDFFTGVATVNSVSTFGTGISQTNTYGKIRSINQFLVKIQDSGLPTYTINKLKGQALFFRAWRYFELVSLYGGVPLILTPQDPLNDDKSTINVKRNKTSECITQICKDLDSAKAYLPGKWATASDWGRITKGAAAAFKGRVLLYWASPQFNPNDDIARWDSAYKANLEAKTILDANGFGLYDPTPADQTATPFANMWFSEVNNPEAVFVTCYNTTTTDPAKKNNSWDNATRPKYLGSAGGSNQPTKEMVDAFPMKDGKKRGASAKYTYNDQYYFRNRDPRFDQTIAFNGCNWSINGNPLYKLWTYIANGTSVESTASTTGFYCRKAINKDLTTSSVVYCGTDWMEIRYAEVLLNLSESACGKSKLGVTDESYTGLIAIRKRARVEAGTDGLYGLTPNMGRTDMFAAILAERQIEFAFEGKRFWDLRRWKLFDNGTNLNLQPQLVGTSRHGVIFTYKTSGNPTPADFAKVRDQSDMVSNVNSTDYTKYFTSSLKSLETSQYPSIKWLSNYYFFALPQTAIDNNPNLEQTQGWNNGTFDPLK